MFLSCQQVFTSFLKIFSSKRRRRDLNPRAAVNDLHPFQGCPFGQLGYFSELITIYRGFREKYKIHRVNLFYIPRIFFAFAKRKRRGWDSNPRALADKRFSRPPRYDHFDTSPYNMKRFSSAQNQYYHQNSMMSTLFFNFFYFFKTSFCLLLFTLYF